MNVDTIQRGVGTLLSLLCISFFAGSCNRRPPKSHIDEAAYAKEIEQWHLERWKELNGESGWLTLVGLYWLKEGRNMVGSDPTMDVILSTDELPPELGNFIVIKGDVGFVPLSEGFTVEGKPLASILPTSESMLPLKSDADDRPTILAHGSLTFQIIKRGDKLGLRVKDSQNPDRLNFKGTEFYPTNSKWRIDAQFEPYNPPKPMPITNVLGMENAESSPGAVKFEVDGKEYRLDAISEKNEPRLFMIIADKTSGKETYPAGRYLYVDPPDASGHTIIDFNKAYSPPCAFTKYATCPLPPRQNRLPIAIEAGEKYKPHSINPHAASN
ncbi:MAG TPA: DUF1684 domain-containing protein [Pyrinomonadaceae bacterium]|jgi:uncharacterized protein (DUF1684 family)|nr:DUF1684 domain-containing protein [Pyrinomonadaceae bacterium]